jgi:hypothetical protein
VFYWIHAERLRQTPPQQWQQHLRQHLSAGTGLAAAASQEAAAAAAAASQAPGGACGGAVSSQHLQLLAGLACDWCCGPLSQAAGRDSSKGVWGCPSCGAAQYCSQGCADAARQVHNANCW